MKEDIVWKDCGRYITVYNRKGDRSHHAHINKGHKKKQIKTANMLIRLIKNKTVPKSSYLRTSALRVSRDERYKENIRIKIEKDKDRIHYHNPQKGAMNGGYRV